MYPSGMSPPCDPIATTPHCCDRHPQPPTPNPTNTRASKSKLRQKDSITLGPEYRGSRVSRAALDQESSDDDDEDEDEDDNDDEDNEDSEMDDLEGSDSEEFADLDAVDLNVNDLGDDVEIESDNALASSDDEKLKEFTFRGSKTPREKELVSRGAKRVTAADYMKSSGDEQSDEDEQSEEEEDFEGSEDDSELEQDSAFLSGEEEEEEEEEEDEDEDDDEDDDDEAGGKDDGATSDFKNIMAEDEKKIVSSMSDAVKADAAKGEAVRSQRRAFDSILNLRVRLQKALIAVNTLPVIDREQEETNTTEPYQAAEEAAVKLWNTIHSVRHTLNPSSKAKAGEKRKREISIDSPTQDIWDSLCEVEAATMSHRRKVLDKWNSKVRYTATAVAKTRRLADSGAQTLVSVLDDQLLNGDRLVKHARTPRSCAPAQAAKKLAEDRDIYDDADFYQLLLKELVDQRSTDAAAPGGQFVATVKWAALKEAKTRKVVDRRASKGRKLRYTVHEKLQNFMAPEDRRQWEEHAVDRFFGTLFGQKMELREEDDEGEDEEMGGVNVEEEGLRLFRS